MNPRLPTGSLPGPVTSLHVRDVDVDGRDDLLIFTEVR